MLKFVVIVVVVWLRCIGLFFVGLPIDVSHWYFFSTHSRRRFFNERTALATFATCQVNNSGIFPQIAPRRPRSHKVSTLLVNGLGMNDVTLESTDEFHVSCGSTTCTR